MTHGTCTPSHDKACKVTTVKGQDVLDDDEREQEDDTVQKVSGCDHVRRVEAGQDKLAEDLREEKWSCKD